MTNVELIIKVLTATYLDKKKTVDPEEVSRIINTVEGIDRVSLLKGLLEELTQNDKLDKKFKKIFSCFPVTGFEFEQLKINFNELFVKDWAYPYRKINISNFQFDTFSEEQMKSFLEIASKKDDKGYNLYVFDFGHPFLKHLTPELYKRYYRKLEFVYENVYREFPHHTRETVLEVLEDNKYPKRKDTYSWAVSTCVLTEQDLEPYIPFIAKANGCFTKEVKNHYSKEFWIKVFMAE